MRHFIKDLKRDEAEQMALTNEVHLYLYILLPNVHKVVLLEDEVVLVKVQLGERVIVQEFTIPSLKDNVQYSVRKFVHQIIHDQVRHLTVRDPMNPILLDKILSMFNSPYTASELFDTAKIVFNGVQGLNKYQNDIYQDTVHGWLVSNILDTTLNYKNRIR